MNFLKKIFKKTSLGSKNQESSITPTLSDRIREMDLNIDEKIELLIREYCGFSEDEPIFDNYSFHSNDLFLDALDVIEFINRVETVFNIEIQEDAILTVGELKQYVENKIKNPDYKIPKEELNSDWLIYLMSDLTSTLNNESMRGRSLAINELMGNNYQILSDEYGNPHKELINFTLKYFSKFFTENPTKAESLLIKSFPLMYQIIRSQILKQEKAVEIMGEIDVQKGYDEFLDFCKNLFTSIYPNKNERDEQIMQNFKILGCSLIHFIENDNQ